MPVGVEAACYQHHCPRLAVTLPGDRPPAPGDLITSNLVVQHGYVYRVDVVFPDEDEPGCFRITATCVEAPGVPGIIGESGYNYSGLRMRCGRCIGHWCPRGTAGRQAQVTWPPWNKAGYIEIAIVKRHPQGRLF